MTNDKMAFIGTTTSFLFSKKEFYSLEVGIGPSMTLSPLSSLKGTERLLGSHATRVYGSSVIVGVFELKVRKDGLIAPQL